MIALGLMSGTSCDGIDAIALRLEGVEAPHEPEVHGHVHVPFEEALRAELLAAHTLTAPRLAELHFELAELHAVAAKQLPNASDAVVCGYHGQTIWHSPPSRGARTACTFQLGSSAVLAARLGVPVVGDLRGADVARGGEGAPIVPFTHAFFTPPSRAPRLVVNFGGICNVTHVTPRLEDVRGWDVGPGMMLSDAHARRLGLDCDRDGAMGRRGKPIAALVDAVLAHPFLAKPAPKSTGREEFGETFSAPLLDRFASYANEDVARSLVEASAVALHRAAGALSLREVIVTGGGARNPALIAAIRARFEHTEVIVAHGGVLAPEHHEPAAMALIAARTLRGLPSSLPAVTGARAASVLGHVHHP